MRRPEDVRDLVEGFSYETPRGEVIRAVLAQHYRSASGDYVVGVNLEGPDGGMGRVDLIFAIDEDGRLGEVGLSEVNLDPEFRRLGLMTAFNRHMEEEYQRQGADRVKLLAVNDGVVA